MRSDSWSQRSLRRSQRRLVATSKRSSVNFCADLAVAAAVMPTRTSRNHVFVGLQGQRRGSCYLIDEASAEHCADVAAEDSPAGARQMPRPLRRSAGEADQT